MYLTIKHIKGAAPLTFCLKKGDDEGSAVILTDPMSLPVEGVDKLSLREGLRWYLEEYPSEPWTHEQKAQAITRTLRRWGSESFNRLFDRCTYWWYKEHQDHLEQLHFRVESESPEVLSWPWEALCATDSEADTEGTYLGPHCSIERRVSSKSTPWTLPEQPEKLRMLLVIARPFGDRDVDFHAVSRAVVDYVRDERCPVEIELLRPPTFEKLCTTLDRAKEEGRQYHIVHFDGHGGYGSFTHHGPGRFQGAEGCLAFETEPKPGQAVQKELVEASRLAQALLRCGVSMVVLNACQSAMVDAQAKNAHASVAASLLRAGVPSVTAMGYSLYVSGAQLFVPAFYKRLFRDGRPAQAMREGRGAMFRAPANRVPHRFQDWLVPQLYQGVSEEGRLLPEPKQAERAPRWERLHLYNENVGPELDKYGLIGRGSQILELERLLHRPQAGILVYGMAGAGKTTLVRGFLRWLRDTGGLRTAEGACPLVWFDFRDQFSAFGLFDYLAR